MMFDLLMPGILADKMGFHIPLMGKSHPIESYESWEYI